MREGQPKQLITPGKHMNFVSRGGWEYVERTKISGIVAIIAVTDEGNLLLIEQFRPPVNGRMIELPAGLAADIAGQETEALANAAHRELLEETGYEAKGMTYLAEGGSSGGITDEIITIFRATGLRRVGPAAGDGHEQITLHEVPLAGAYQWVQDRVKEGLHVDLKVFSGLYFATQQ